MINKKRKATVKVMNQVTTSNETSKARY